MSMRLRIGPRTSLRMRALPNIGLPVAGFGIGLTKTAGSTEIAITNPNLVALGWLVSAANMLPYFTGPGATALCTFQAYGRTLVAAADAGAARTTLGLVPGTDVQAFDGDLAALAALTTTGIAVRTSANTWATRTLLGATGVVTVTNGSGGAGDPVIDIAPGAIDYARMQAVSATARVLGRKSAGAGVVQELTTSELLDFLGAAAHGDMLVRGASGWGLLPAGTSGYFLRAAGAGALPAWASIPGGGDLLSTNNLADLASIATARTNLGLPAATTPFAFRNRIINGNFAINQRVVSGTVTLAAGAYGHDRWKAGAGGCTYTFTTTGLDTTITITSGTLCQVIHSSNVEGGVYTASWSGTAQARVYQGSPSGSYASGPLTTASLTAATNTTIEFATGTLTRVQIEPGALATAFERCDDELRRCWRYYWRWRPGATAKSLNVFSIYSSTESYGKLFDLPVEMIAVPTVSVSSPSHFECYGTVGQSLTSMPLAGTTKTTIAGSVFYGSSAGGAGVAAIINTTSPSAWIAASAEI